MECISVFDMLKIGIGPSSSHTLGPWRAAEQWLAHLKSKDILQHVNHVKIDLYGSLSLTGIGHATDLAVMLGLSGADPVTIPIKDIQPTIDKIKTSEILNLNGEFEISFSTKNDISFNRDFLPFHANGLTFKASNNGVELDSSTYYSIGGGFVVQEEHTGEKEKAAIYKTFPHPIQTAKELEQHCEEEKLKISEIVWKNEVSQKSPTEIDTEIHAIWNTMLECMYTGCHTEGMLPGGLNVRRRAFDMHQKLKGETPYSNPTEWIDAIRKTKVRFRQIFKWVYRIAYNTCLDRLKGNTKFVKNVEINEITENQLEDTSNVFESLARDERKEIVQECMNQLPADERAVLHLFYFEENSLKEIAEITALSSNNVKVKLHRARKKLFTIFKNSVDHEIYSHYEQRAEG